MTTSPSNNRYRIIRALGTGGFGETFLAEDTHLPSGRYCVIKQLKPVTSTPQVTRLIQERFGREAVILEQLGEGSDRIPKLYAYFAERGQFYLVQEWIEGVTLNQKLQQDGILSENAVTEILLELLPVLDYIHSKGIIHRDIKPSNIILRHRDGKPVLIDFGIAKETVSLEMNDRGEIASSIAIGTKGFMPLEQAAGKPVHASDIYSLGLTAIYLLTGKLPQQLNTDPQTGEIICRADVLKISDNLTVVLEKATRSHPRERYPNAESMLAALSPRDRLLQLPETILPYQTETLPPPVLSHRISNVKTTNNRQIPLNYTPQEYRYRQILLNKVKNYWIEGVLETSLHGRALISLGLEKRLDAVDRPWGIVWESADRTKQTLPSNTKIIDQFDQLGAGRTLLILGEPGAGKTTTLLELARDLLLRAQTDIDRQIPVIFNLSSWSHEKQAIAPWLIQELNHKYQVSKEISRDWIEKEQLLLLLDGLDEVNIKLRESCVRAINQFSQSHGLTEIVVCSRIKDYEILSNRLKFQGAIFIQPLTLEQIHQYLDKIGSELTAVNTALRADTVLQELARSPLILSIMTLAYQGMSVTDLPEMNLESRRKHLFDRYIERMFERRSTARNYSKERATYWLIWLAKRLTQQSLTVFLLDEGIQPNWLQTQWEKQIYLSGIWLSFVALGGWITHLVLPLDRVILTVIFAGLIFSWIFNLNYINPVATLKWSWKKAQKNLTLGLTLGLILGLVIKIIHELIFHPLHWNIFSQIGTPPLFFSLMRGVVFGVSIGLVFGLSRGLTGPNIEAIAIPNQGIWQSAKNAVIFALIGGLVLGTSAKILDWPIFFWGIFGLSFGLAVGGGEVCLKHFILRVILYFKGYIPWNYARFLDYATERIFLQKVGGGYLFVHRLLLEHFAQLE